MSYLITEWYDTETDATGYLVIDQLKNGFCAGGIRMRKGVTKEEVAKLAEIMTIKMAGLGLNIGGAKGGIDFDSKDPRALGVLERYLQAHLPYIKTNWLTSEDLGTREEDIIAILNNFGLNTSVDAYINASDNATTILSSLKKALTEQYDGFSLTDLVTGYGVTVSTIAALKSKNISLEQAKIAVQGFGSVGAGAVKFLSEKGATIVAVADIQGTIYCPDGLDFNLLNKYKDKTGLIDRSNLPDNYKQLPSDAWIKVDADVLIPAAIADAINLDNVDVINASIIVEGANIPVSAEAEKILFEKGIMVVPDFIANSGGAGLFVAILANGADGTPEQIFKFLQDRLSKTTEQVISIANKEQLPLREAAKFLIKETIV